MCCKWMLVQVYWATQVVRRFKKLLPPFITHCRLSENLNSNCIINVPNLFPAPTQKRKAIWLHMWDYRFKSNFFCSIILMFIIIYNSDNHTTELWNINQLIGYRDVNWYINDTWIGFSTQNFVKQSVACSTYMASRVWNSA